MWGYVELATALSAALSLLTGYTSDTQTPSAATAPPHTVPVANGGAWAEAFQHAQAVVKQMTLEEKVGHLRFWLTKLKAWVNMTSAVVGPCQANSGGVPRLGIPGLCFNDGRELRQGELTGS